MAEKDALEIVERLQIMRQLVDNLATTPKENVRQEDLFNLSKKTEELWQSLQKMGQQVVTGGSPYEPFPVVFKAIVDKTGRITIPLPERQAERIESGMVVQVKIKVLRQPKVL